MVVIQEQVICIQNKKRKLSNKYDTFNLFLETYDYEDWLKNKELAGTTRKSNKEEYVDSSDMPQLEGDEEVKEEN